MITNLNIKKIYEQFMIAEVINLLNLTCQAFFAAPSKKILLSSHGFFS